MGVLVSACPTQTQVVKCSSPPQNQASPLFSVVPVLPHSASSPNWASLPVPSRTLRCQMFLIVDTTPEDRTRAVLVLFSATVLPFGSVTLSIATGARSKRLSLGPAVESRFPPTRSPPCEIVVNA